MDHPITTIMLIVGLISLGFLAFEEMQVNIFPSMNVPKIADFHEEARTLAREHPRITWGSAILLLLLFLAAVGGAGMAVWEWHAANQARKAEQQAIEKRDKAEKEAEKAKGKLKRAEANAKERIRERDQAQEGERTARRSEEELKAIRISDECCSVVYASGSLRCGNVRLLTSLIRFAHPRALDGCTSLPNAPAATQLCKPQLLSLTPFLAMGTCSRSVPSGLARSLP